MVEETDPPSDLPETREKGEESYDPAESPLIKKKEKPTELPPTREIHEGEYEETTVGKNQLVEK